MRQPFVRSISARFEHSYVRNRPERPSSAAAQCRKRRRSARSGIKERKKEEGNPNENMHSIKWSFSIENPQPSYFRLDNFCEMENMKIGRTGQYTFRSIQITTFLPRSAFVSSIRVLSPSRPPFYCSSSDPLSAGRYPLMHGVVVARHLFNSLFSIHSVCWCVFARVANLITILLLSVRGWSRR